MQKIERQDVYTRVTNRIIADLENGVRPWVKPWSTGHTEGQIMRPLRHNGTPYTGINIVMLWASSLEQGFGSPMWMTFRQAKELGARVRKGEKGALVVYANKITRTAEDDQGEEVEREIPFMKGYTVFNVEQIEALPEHYYVRPEPRFKPVQRIDHAEAFFAALRADIRYRGGQAYYAQALDYIQIPPIEAFRDAESFYATLAHEATHWTKHPTGLTGNSDARSGVMRATPARSSSPRSALPFCALISRSRRRCGRTTPPISPAGWKY